MAERLSDELRAQVVERYRDGQSSVAIAKAMSLGTTTVLRVLKQNGISPLAVSAGRERAGRKVPNEARAAIAEKYIKGANLKDLGAEYGVAWQSIGFILVRLGVKLRDKGKRYKPISDADVAAMSDLWKSGASQTAIAERLSISQANVGRTLRKIGIDCTKRNVKAHRHGNWRGGKISMGGYFYVHVAQDDPLFSMTNSMGYVAEHRLVMAKHLGRALLPTETVHHIDGDRKHNDLANLQLRIGHHGNGVAYECACCGSRNLRPIALG